MKPEFFCCIGGELKDTIQGIFKCSRIFLYRAAQSQTIDDMLVDGFFNEADDIRVNDLIILYCPEESRAYTFAKVSSIINGVVKTKELDTPNLPANVSAFFNDVGYLTAADLATVAFTGNLSDLNDTTITNPATGEYLRWNGDKWINMAGGGGGSAVWGSVGGDIEDQADLQAALADKANVDLDNLSATGQAKFDAKANVDMDNLTSVGQNIANWSTNVTNCITEIPQDIKLELNAGVLTLKAGSKVYRPNGVGVYNEITIASDVVYNFGSATGTFFVFNTGATFQLVDCVSGTTDSLAGQSYHVWYDTTNNLIKLFGSDGNTPLGNISFPLGIISVTSGSVDNIDQIFNGFGYIGSTVFALPGLKVVIPNGRNTNGTLKNIPITLSSVTTYTANITGTNNVVILSDGSINLAGINYWIYNEHKNTWVHDNNTLAMASIANSNHNTTITSFTPKTVFHAFDYNDLMIMTLNTLYPVGSIYIGTQATCPLATLIPGSMWSQIQGRYLLASGTLAGTSESYSATNTVASGLPNVTGGFNVCADFESPWGAFSASTQGIRGAENIGYDGGYANFNASNSNSIYGQSAAVRSPAYVVNVWRRTA